MTILTTIEKTLKKEYSYTKRMYFNDDFSLHNTMVNHLKVITDSIKRGETSVFVGFEELAEFYLMTALYAQEFSDDKTKIKNLLTEASAYSYSLLILFNKQCPESHECIVLMRKAIYLWSSLFFVGWNDEGMRVGSELLDSLNKKGSIIRYGSRLYPESWFLIDIYSLATHQTYDKSYVDYPEDMRAYKDILKYWDTKDLVSVDLFVNTLCNSFLEIRETNEDEPDDEYLNFNKSIMKLYPFTAITYLSFRKQKGLENPKEFSHPLMNTPIATFFLGLKNPLNKPQNLPYTKELLTKLKEKCPDIEIPDWL